MACPRVGGAVVGSPPGCDSRDDAVRPLTVRGRNFAGVALL